MIDEAVDLVKEFQKRARQPVANEPTILTSFQVQRRIDWIKKEIDELYDASNIYEQADALVDTLYYLLGAFVEMGIYPDELFKVVHQYNMKKVDSTNAVHDIDGRILKPNNWSHPDLEIKCIIDGMTDNSLEIE